MEHMAGVEQPVPALGGGGAGGGAVARTFRLRHHLLPALAVLTVVAALFALATVVFMLVFLVDDEAELKLGEALVGGASLLGVIVGATLAVTVVGMVLDRVTLRAPLLVRVAVVAVVPLLGVILVAAGVDTGYLVLEVSVLLVGYWAVFLGQSAVLGVGRWLRGRLSTRA